MGNVFGMSNESKRSYFFVILPTILNENFGYASVEDFPLNYRKVEDYVQNCLNLLILNN